MVAPLTRCHCGECTKLDRLPVRRQGIPGAFQMTFDHARLAPIDWPEVEPYQGRGPAMRRTASAGAVKIESYAYAYVQEPVATIGGKAVYAASNYTSYA